MLVLGLSIIGSKKNKGPLGNFAFNIRRTE